ncbi:hypothetical protein CSKR_105034 [Clonorchis sinensis]|uniref:Uncharacterized protein n=1 Tax=Clonorchis sinensis TaxID=79923 RepID=A0A419PT41_CLOSI|nr:hypothetical protein CSKR_105034 [Clonorchis sinensis]
MQPKFIIHSEVPLDKGFKLTMDHRAVNKYLEVLLRLGSDSLKDEMVRLDKHTEGLARSVEVQQVPLPSLPPEIKTPSNNQPGLLLPKPSTDKSATHLIRIPKFHKQRHSTLAMRQTQPARTRRKPALQARETMEIDLDSSIFLEATAFGELRARMAAMHISKCIVKPGGRRPLALIADSIILSSLNGCTVTTAFGGSIRFASNINKLHLECESAIFFALLATSIALLSSFRSCM